MAYKELTPPNMPGIGDQSPSSLSFTALGRKLYDLIGLNINPLSPGFGRAGK